MSTIHIKGRLIAGIRAVAVRDAFRSCSNYESFIHGFIAEKCKVSDRKAREICKELLEEDFLEITEPPRSAENKGTRWYKMTKEGFKFSNATGLHRMSREKAERMLRDFLKRVEEVNINTEYMYRVGTVVVSGSYARGENSLGDLDIFCQLQQKCEDYDRDRCEQGRIKAARAKGRRFSNIVDELFWPRNEVRLHLKGRTPGLSLHEIDEFFKMAKDDRFAYEVLSGSAEYVKAKLNLMPDAPMGSAT